MICRGKFKYSVNLSGLYKVFSPMKQLWLMLNHTSKIHLSYTCQPCHLEYYLDFDIYLYRASCILRSHFIEKRRFDGKNY